jgi:excisionase family DNA binding protein
MAARQGSTRHLTIAEASLRLGVTYTQAYNRALKGELEAAKIGGRLLVTEASVERLRAERGAP